MYGGDESRDDSRLSRLDSLRHGLRQFSIEISAYWHEPARAYVLAVSERISMRASFLGARLLTGT